MSEQLPQEGVGGSEDPNTRWALQHVTEALRNLRFGVVTLTVQDGVVVQIERTERKRYQRQASDRAS